MNLSGNPFIEIPLNEKEEKSMKSPQEWTGSNLKGGITNNALNQNGESTKKRRKNEVALKTRRRKELEVKLLALTLSFDGLSRFELRSAG